VGVDAAGRLDAARLTRNIRSQPPTQQRRVLQAGLRDLLERGMERCAAQLEPEQADALLLTVGAHLRRLQR
jgi:hypothetical protein